MIGLGWRGKEFDKRLTIDDATGAQIITPRGEGPRAGHGPRHEFQIQVRHVGITLFRPREMFDVPPDVLVYRLAIAGTPLYHQRAQIQAIEDALSARTGCHVCSSLDLWSSVSTWQRRSPHGVASVTRMGRGGP